MANLLNIVAALNSCYKELAVSISTDFTNHTVTFTLRRRGHSPIEKGYIAKLCLTREQVEDEALLRHHLSTLAETADSMEAIACLDRL